MKNLLSVILFLTFTSKVYGAELEPFILDFTAKLSGNIPNPDLLNHKDKNVNEVRFLNYSLTCEDKLNGCILTVFSMLNSFCDEKMKKPNIYENGYYFDRFEKSSGLEVFSNKKNQVQIIYTDASFYGNTKNSLIVNYQKDDKYNYGIKATNIEGKAFTLHATLGASISANYSTLDKPVICQVNFLPTAK
jgi:hypothetical protein